MKVSVGLGTDGFQPWAKSFQGSTKLERPMAHGLSWSQRGGLSMEGKIGTWPFWTLLSPPLLTCSTTSENTPGKASCFHDKMETMKDVCS